jgi:hypothetical protein
MEWILLGIVAFGCGFAVAQVFKRKKKTPETVGTLWIDISKSEEPELYTTLYADPTETDWQTHATFDVRLVK